MRKLLLTLIILESTALVALGGALLFGVLDRYERRPPTIPVFKPPIYEAVIGDAVRYQRRDPKTGKVLGYLDYTIHRAYEMRSTTLGREFIVKLTKTDEGGSPVTRFLRLRPRDVVHGFLPPRFEEDDGYPSGERPVIKTIRTAPVRVRKKDVRGFLLEAVTPRRSVTEVRERFWITPAVPVFGVARWERPDEELVLFRMEKMGP